MPCPLALYYSYDIEITTLGPLRHPVRVVFAADFTRSRAANGPLSDRLHGKDRAGNGGTGAAAAKLPGGAAGREGMGDRRSSRRWPLPDVGVGHAALAVTAGVYGRGEADWIQPRSGVCNSSRVDFISGRAFFRTGSDCPDYRGTVLPKFSSALRDGFGGFPKSSSGNIFRRRAACKRRALHTFASGVAGGRDFCSGAVLFSETNEKFVRVHPLPCDDKPAAGNIRSAHGAVAVLVRGVVFTL